MYIYHLGVLTDDKVKWSKNVYAFYSKSQQRLFFVRRLKSFYMDKGTLTKFVLLFGTTKATNKSMLEKVASKITGLNLPTLESVYCPKPVIKSPPAVKGNNVLSHCVKIR